MLFDAIVPGDDERNVIQPVLARRVRYLMNHARQWAEPVAELPREAWEVAATKSTLHLEAAESAAVLGEFDDARFEIGVAVDEFHQTRMPYGVALQRAFVADHGSLAARGDEVLAEWNALLATTEDDTILGEVANAPIQRVAAVPQQWAYYGLCLALERTVQPETAHAVAERLAGWQSVPMGRMRFPMDHWLVVLMYCRQAKESRGDVSVQAQGVVIEILSKQIVALLRAVQYARANTYLWKRALAPAPWFDFDVALLVAAVLDSPGALSENLRERIGRTVSDDASFYTDEFIQTVTRLMAR